MSIYYVAQDGTAANKAAATGGTYPGDYMSLETYSSESPYSAGDTIRFSDKGGDMQRTDGYPVYGIGGSVGSPITYEAASGETPVFTGKEVLTSASYKWTTTTNWTSSYKEYYCELAAGGDPDLTDSHMLFVDDVPQTEGSAVGSLNDHEWIFGDDGVMGFDSFIFRDETGDPDTSGIEVMTPQYGCFTIYEEDYVVVDGLTIKHGYNPSGTIYAGRSTNITFQNLIAQYNYAGIGLDNSEDCTIDSCTSSYNGQSNIHATGCTRVLFSNNTAHHSITTLWVPSPFNGYGLKFLRTTDSIMRNNNIYDNDFQGIDLDIDCNDNLIHENKINDNGSYGILIEISSLRNHVFHNLMYDNGTGYEIELNDSSHGCHVYNNVIYRTVSTTSYPIGVHSSRGVRVIGNVIDSNGYSSRCMTISGGDSARGAIIKNNIFVGSTDVALAISSTDFTGLVCDYNLYNREDDSATVILYDAATYTVINGGSGTWYTSQSQGQNSLEESPDFFDAANHKYWLATGSPCIGAGVSL